MAMLLKPVTNPSEKIWTPTPIVQLLPLVAYYLFVLAAPFAVGTGIFIFVVIIIRLLLFCPFILPAIVSEGGGMSYLTPRKAKWAGAGPFQFIGICSVLLWTMQTLVTLKDNGFHLGIIIGSVNDSPAVSALGFDYVLSLASLAIWALSVGSDLG